MHAYPYFAADAGRYMVSEAETRALLEYVIKHRNIAAILTFGESDNLIAAGRAPNNRHQPDRVRRIGASPMRAASACSPTRAGWAAAVAAGAAAGWRSTKLRSWPDGPRRRGGAAGGRAWRARGHGGRNDSEPGGRRVSQHHRREVPRADRPAHGRRHAHAGRRVLRIRLLPVRRAVVLDPGLGPARRQAADAAAGRAAPQRPEEACRRWAARRARRRSASEARAVAAQAAERRRGRCRGHRPAPAAVDGRREDRRIRDLDRRSSTRRWATWRSAASSRTRP